MTLLTVHGYAALVVNQSTDQLSRVLVAPNADIAHQLLRFHVDHKADIVRVRDCIFRDETAWLPMAGEVFARIEKSIRQRKVDGRAVVVVGLDSYLALLDGQQVHTALARLHQLVDKDEHCVIFIITAAWTKGLREVFENPKYESGKKIIFFSGDTDYPAIPTVVLVSTKWVQMKPPIRGSFRDYLQHVGDFSVFDAIPATIALPLGDQLIPGLNPDLKQIVTLADCMRYFYNIYDELPETTLQWVLSQVQARRCSSGLEAVRQSFGLDGDLVRVAPKRLAASSGEVEGAAWLWMLRKTVRQDSYLQRVLLLPNLTPDNFLQSYVADGALACMGDDEAEQLAVERQAALREIDDPYEAHVIRLIGESSNRPIHHVAVWLKSETSYEHTELVRRCATLDPTANVPEAVLKAYPLLADYASGYSYGSPELDRYFRDYRKLKLWNTITPDFCQVAFDATVPKSVQSRDAIIQLYSTDGKSALLVIDGMGVEYLPALLAQANRRKLNVTRHTVATSCLPTSTRFNIFTWPSERRLQDIKQIDRVAHDGAKVHEPNTYAENLVSVLDEMVAKRIFEAIADGLTRFEQVVVTADHGTSRLAVLAYENGLSITLPKPSKENVLDWRYTAATEGEACPVGMEDTFDGKYWVVRGYNRLPKEGGKKYELHGGATLEERLVPVVVFKRGAVLDSHKIEPIKPAEQLVEKDDFDL